MTQFERRVKVLESRTGTTSHDVTAIIIRSFVPPGYHGQEDEGCGFANIIAGPNQGMQLEMRTGETMEAFERRVEAASNGSTQPN